MTNRRYVNCLLRYDIVVLRPQHFDDALCKAVCYVCTAATLSAVLFQFCELQMRAFKGFAPHILEFVATHCQLLVVWDSIELPRTGRLLDEYGILGVHKYTSANLLYTHIALSGEEASNL